jgi:hypothetical protein
MEEIISEKKELDEASSSCSNTTDDEMSVMPTTRAPFGFMTYVSGVDRTAHFVSCLLA